MFGAGLSNAMGAALLRLPGADSPGGLTALVVGATTALSGIGRRPGLGPSYATMTTR